MRLEDKFFTSFFYIFFIGMYVSLIKVTVILVYFSNDFIDERTSSEVLHIEKRYATSNINSMIVLLSNLILKIQLALQEQI